MVIVVDDDPDLQDLVGLILQMDRRAVARAESGSAALEAMRAARQRPCLVLLDLMLPDMRGEDVYQGLRALPPPWTSVPVVIMSATVDGGKRAERLGLPFLPKPFEIDDLLRVVARHCGEERN